MFDKRLFTLAPGVARLIAGKIACLWVSLLANIVFVVALVSLLSGLIAAVDPGAGAAGTGGVAGTADAAGTAGAATGFAGLPGLAGLPGGALAVQTAAIYAAVFAACALVRYAATRIGAGAGTEAAERVKLGLRERLYRKMLALGPSYGTRVKTADVVQSAGEGVEQIQSFFELFLPQLFYAVAAPITLFAVIAPLNMPTALTLLVCAPLIVIIVGLVAMSAARMFKKYWGTYTDMGATFLDDMQGLETLTIFDADERAARQMDAKAERFRIMTMRVLQIQLRSLSAMDLVAYGGTAAGIGVALWQYAAGIASGQPTLGLSGVVLIVLLSADFFIPLRQLGSYFHVAMNGMTSTKRIFALLDAPEPAYGDVTLATDAGAPVVVFDGVGYAYERDGAVARTRAGADADEGRPTADALTNVTFMADPGRVTAIVGVSGSGKSTMAALLAGTLTGYTGSIALLDRIGRHELHDLTAASLTRAVTLVGARSHLFAGTLRDNLLLARPDADDDDLWAALRGAHIDEFVRGQADGLAMRIESGAANLSGGQRQRIAIARALLHDSAIYVFDEATSSVDVDSEALILATIRELADAGKTVLMITHRMANAADADIAIVFSHGAVTESGTHRGLLAAGRTYADLYRTQTAIEGVCRRAGAPTAAEPAAEPAAAEPASAVDGGQSSDHPQSAMPTAPAGGGGDGRGLVVDARVQSSSSRWREVSCSDGGWSAEPASAVDGGRSSDHPQSAAPTAPACGSDDGHGLAAPAGGESTMALVRRLLHEARPLAGFMAAASITGTIGHLAATFLPVFGVVAAFALAGSPVWGMGVPAAVTAMAVCAVLRGVMRYIEQYLNHNVAFRLLALFRSKAFAALRRLAPAKLASRGKGDLIALITTDVELLEIFFAHTISPVVIAVATSVVYALLLVTLRPAMALLLIGSHLVIGVLVPRFFATGVQNLGPTIRRQSSELDDVMLDDMRGLSEIIGFGRGEARVEQIVARTRSLWAEHARLSRVNGGFAGIGMVLVMTLTIMAAAVGVALAGGMAGMPALVTAVVLIASSFGPTLALSALPANLTQTFAAARRLFALMDETPAVEERGTCTPDWHGMTLDGVTFAYDAGHAAPRSQTGADRTIPSDSDERRRATACGGQPVPVLSDVSLDVPERGILGVQGPSGRGKSTLLKLLMRYWDPQRGTVTLSGEPLPAVNAHHRRLVQTMMSQETSLFDGTIRDNLLIALPQSAEGGPGDAVSGARWRELPAQSAEGGPGGAVSGARWRELPAQPAEGGPGDAVSGARWRELPAQSAEGGPGDATLDELLRDACRKASVLDLIDSLPDGLDTPVGELGDRLSEGERQRIGLARIFLRKADLALFDEPTSRLDALNESVILQSINTLADGEDTAIVLVSHRASTMRIADQVITM